VGFSFAADDKTVFRGGFGMLYSHGGGTGGAGAVGTGQTGFNTPVSFPVNAAGPTGNPVFYLNNSTGFQAAGIANTNFGGPGYSLPGITPPSATTQLTAGLVGNFVNSSGAFVKSSTGVNYADPYYGDRTPTFYFFNLGFQRAFTKDITYTMNYAGSMSHFISGAAGIRGLQSGGQSDVSPAGCVVDEGSDPSQCGSGAVDYPRMLQRAVCWLYCGSKYDCWRWLCNDRSGIEMDAAIHQHSRHLGPVLRQCRV
jgi:hypothetical protein